MTGVPAPDLVAGTPGVIPAGSDVLVPVPDAGSGAWRTGAGDRWHVALWHGPLPADALARWAGRPGCGAVVTFAGTTRDHGRIPGGGVRTGVTLLEYEAYEGPALERLAAVADSVLEGWPDCGALVLAHRLGPVPLSEASVLVVVSAPHRDTAFEAARHAIDTLKATVPIWKREHHDAGIDWGADVTPLGGPGDRAVVRRGGLVADTGGAARRADSIGTLPPDGDQSATPDPQESSWAT